MSVRRLKVGEFGRDLVVGAGVDISGAVSWDVEFTKPDGTTVTKSATLGAVEITIDDKDGEPVTFAADTYVTYTIEDGLIDKPGRWTYRLLAPTATVSVPGECGTFEVV